MDTAEIRLWFASLAHVVSRLERMHAPLVDAIINMPWMTLDTATVKAYTLFIGMLLSARPEYLSAVLAKIALGFTYRQLPPKLSPHKRIDMVTQNLARRHLTQACRLRRQDHSQEERFMNEYTICSDICCPSSRHCHPPFSPS
jgi:hypothetical protein